MTAPGGRGLEIYRFPALKGVADPEAKASDIATTRLEYDPLDQAKNLFGQSKDSADKMVQSMHMGRRIDLDMALDRFNPQERLPISKNMEDQVPDFKPTMLDLAAPEDYSAHDQVAQVQTARANFLREDLKYDNPRPSIKYPASTDFSLPEPPRGTSVYPRGFFSADDQIAPQDF